MTDMLSIDHADALTRAVREANVCARELHRALLERARRDYERMNGAAVSGGEWLQLVLREPAYAWMRELSALLADLDALLDGDDVTGDDAAAAGAELRRLVSPQTGEPDGFFGSYLPLLQSDPDVLLAHGRLRRAIGGLPGEAAGRLDARERRAGWTSRRARR